MVSAETPSWITAKTYPGARAENIYIKYSSNTTMPQGIYQQTGSGFTFLIRDIVLDWQDAPTVKVENDKVYEGTTEITSGVGIYTAGGDAYAYLMSGRPTINRVYSISKYPLMYKTGTVKLNDNSGCRYVNFNSDGTKYNLVYNKTYLPTRVFGFANNTTLADITAFYNGFVNLDAGVATDISYTVQYRSTVLAFDNNTQFASGIGNSLNNFKNNAYWDTTSGYPVWKNL